MTDMSELPLIQDPQAPQIFATQIGALVKVGSGNVIMTLESLANGPTGEMTRVVVGRIIMPVEGAQALITKLSTGLDQQALNQISAAAKIATRQ